LIPDFSPPFNANDNIIPASILTQIISSRLFSCVTFWAVDFTKGYFPLPLFLLWISHQIISGAVISAVHFPTGYFPVL